MCPTMSIAMLRSSSRLLDEVPVSTGPPRSSLQLMLKLGSLHFRWLPLAT